MKAIVPAVILAGVALAIAGCQSGRSAATAEAAPAAVATTPSGVALPSTVPADARKLTGEEIQTAFAGVRENYISAVNEGVTATGVWTADGKMSATWVDGAYSGDVTGDWYVEGDMRCIRFTSGAGDGPNPECTEVYQFADGYLSVFPDGSINGFHTNTPL